MSSGNRANVNEDLKENIDEAIDDDSGVSISGACSQSSSESFSGSDGGGCEGRMEGDGDLSPPIETNNQRQLQCEMAKKALCEVQCKAERLAEFIVTNILAGSGTIKPTDEVEETLLRCTKSMTSKHQILFNGMMRRLNINDETAYTAFITVVNELFEGDKMIVNWGRIIAFYSFGAQLALHCRERNLAECGKRIPIYLGRYAKEVISSYVYQEGGWKKLCEEFPPENNFENKVFRLLTWTAVGLGLATAACFVTSQSH